ncbi:MAG TPA: hypothetical protein VG713_16375 [Pirellulales bacterium]|nr:hypothetical protein [Pirellulales bacterium]
MRTLRLLVGTAVMGISAAAAVAADPAPVQPQVARPAQAPVVQYVPRRVYRSNSYFVQERIQPYQRSWVGQGRNGAHYSSRADNKVFFRSGHES